MDNPFLDPTYPNRLEEATRVRLTPEVVAELRETAECYLNCGDVADRRLGHGLSILLDMHDKLEALSRG